MTQHKHIEIATEWMKDTSRVIEVNHDGCWRVTRVPKWFEDQEYRFADQPHNVVVTSSLTDDEILTGTCGTHSGINYRRKIADMSAQRQYDDDLKEREQLQRELDHAKKHNTFAYKKISDLLEELDTLRKQIPPIYQIHSSHKPTWG